MTPKQALSKLKKLLGPTAFYRIDPNAADADEREKARELKREAIAQRDRITRERELLRAKLLSDPEYQRLLAAEIAARNQCDELASRVCSYRITAGVSTSLFNHVKAQGDTWADVFEQLGERK